MKILKYKYNPNKRGVFRISVVPKPAVGEGDLVLMSADLENGDAPITTYADMLVTNPEGKVLILKRNPDCEFEPNKWGFPGGKVMPGETTKLGAIRECLEECGITIDPESVQGIGEVSNDDKTSSNYFKGTPTSELKLGDEHQDYAWIDADDLDDYELILNNKDRFKKLITGDTVYMESQEIKGVFYAPVMIPDLKITRIDEATKEKYQVYYDAETVEQLANNYWKQCGNRNTNLDHADENTDGIYPVESWIVKDPVQDKSKALGMPEQKIGTWIMGYKADSPEVLEQVKQKLLNGLSIEGNLDMEEDADNPITKFNKHFMKKTPLEFAKHLANVIMSAVSDEEKPAEKTAEELAAEEEKKKQEMASEKTPEEIAAEEEASKKAAEGHDTPDPAKELETAKATITELEKKVSDLEAELATFKNDAVLMSAQLEKVNTAFEAYKTVKMSSQSLGSLENKKVDKPYAEMSNAERVKYNRNN